MAVVAFLAVPGLMGKATSSTTSATCCAPEPSPGQLFLQSYNFVVNGSSSSIFAVFGVFEGKNVTVSSVAYDGITLTPLNSNVTSSCGTQTYGSSPAQWTGYVCELTVKFGPTFAPPAQGTEHALQVTTSTGYASSFQVAAGVLYESTDTATA